MSPSERRLEVRSIDLHALLGEPGRHVVDALVDCGEAQLVSADDRIREQGAPPKAEAVATGVLREPDARCQPQRECRNRRPEVRAQLDRHLGQQRPDAAEVLAVEVQHRGVAAVEPHGMVGKLELKRHTRLVEACGELRDERRRARARGTPIHADVRLRRPLGRDVPEHGPEPGRDSGQFVRHTDPDGRPWDDIAVAVRDRDADPEARVGDHRLIGRDAHDRPSSLPYRAAGVRSGHRVEQPRIRRRGLGLSPTRDHRPAVAVKRSVKLLAQAGHEIPAALSVVEPGGERRPGAPAPVAEPGILGRAADGHRFDGGGDLFAVAVHARSLRRVGPATSGRRSMLSARCTSVTTCADGLD